MRRNVAVIGLFVFLTIVFFREIFLNGFLPIQFNILPSFYSPWKQETWEAYPQGVPNKPLGTDVPRLFYPYKKFTIEQLTHRAVPLWNPYVFSGNVHHATYQSAVFYPFNIVYFFLPLRYAWTVLILLQPVLAGYFLFLFLRSLQFKSVSSVFGAVTYAFSGWMIVWWEESLVIVHSILWLPLALYGLQLIWTGTKKMLRCGLFVLFCSVVMSILAGFLQMTVYMLIAVLAFDFYRYAYSERKDKNLLLYLTLMSVVLAIVCTAVQWVPALEAYRYSFRGGTDAKFLFDEYLMPIRHLITLFAPDFWGNPASYNHFYNPGYYHEKMVFLGIVPLVFIVYSLLSKKSRDQKFFLYFSLVTFSMGFNFFTSWLPYVLHIPILSTGLPSRIFALSTFGLSVLTAYGFHGYLLKKNKKLVNRAIFYIGLFALLSWIFVLFTRYLLAGCNETGNFITKHFCSALQYEEYKNLLVMYASVTFRNLILPSVVLFCAFIVIHICSKNTVLIAALVALTLFSSMFFARKYLYFSDPVFEFPKTQMIEKLKELSGYFRIWGYGEAYVPANLLSYYGLYSPEGYDALFSRKYGQLLSVIDNNGKIGSSSRTDATLKASLERDSLIDNPYRLKIMSLMGVKYIIEVKEAENKEILTMDERFPSDIFTVAWENDIWRIWEYKDVLPRGFFTNSTVTIKDSDEIIKRLFDEDFFLNETIIISGEANTAKNNEELVFSDVKIKIYEPMHVVLDVDTSVDGYVYLSDQWYPGWEAYVDGVKTPIERANYAFRAVKVSKFSKQIVMKYVPRSFVVSAYVSICGIVLTYIFFVRIKYRKKTSV